MDLFVEMAPYLMLGLIAAGVLHILFPTSVVTRHLGRKKLSSVVKAAVLGMPLPLCSCGVIPMAASLRHQGASRGAVLSFLISTPTTGVDSILATYSLLGIVFTVFRAVGSLIGGILTGAVANLFEKGKSEYEPVEENECKVCAVPEPHSHTPGERVRAMLRHAFYQLARDIGKPLIIGTIVGGFISYLVPQAFFERYLAGTWTPMLVMLAVGIPLYVCATGSIPIAASLILKGMSPGAGLVFLVAGPATNTVTISTVWKTMGRKALALYLGAIVVTSLGLGFLMDLLFRGRILVEAAHVHGGGLPMWLKYAAGAILLGLILNAVLRRSGEDERELASGKTEVFVVPGMSCEHCKNAIQGALSRVAGVKDVGIDLKLKTVTVVGDFEMESARAAIRDAGYEIEEN
jgi:uncharacterized membrane protein YraQ (UPF0718 family)/copper chaperone CopZ